MEKNKWEFKAHSHAIADTGDYDGYYEITNGDITLVTRDDYEETERQLKIAVAFLNRWDINFYDQKVEDLAIDIHCMKDAQRWKDEEYAALRAKADRMEQERYEMRLAMRMLLKAFMHVDLSRDQEKYYKQADVIFKKYHNVTDVLRSEALEQEGEKELTCQEANKACDQLDVCQVYGRCLRQNCTGLRNPEKEPVPQQGPVTTVFVPCAEEDPRAVGAYTSNDGRSLCHVRESEVPVIEQGAVWVKAVDRLPASWHLKCVRFIHTKQPLVQPETWLNENTKAIEVVEWLDETGKECKP